MLNVVVVGLGGFLGACSRYGLTNLLNRFPSFPFGTLLSNVIAAFAIGLIIGAERQTGALSGRAKLFLTTGLLGGLSTFSTFSLDTVTMLEQGKYLAASGNILLNVGLCLVLVFAGFLVARLIWTA
jgi:CrcB protein